MPGASVDPPARPAGPWWAVPLVALGLCVPLLVALAAFRRPVWTPVLDLAMTELRVRDVGGAHTPLVGLPGRIGSLDHPGSHPGPLSFYALAPIYRLLGSTAWALQVATVAVHGVAVGAGLWLARRRGGLLLVAGVAVLFALLLAAYGGGALTEPWNPYLPLLWWVVVLLAAWSVLTGDLVALPLLVLAASFCAQTHVPYLGMCLGVGAVALVGAVVAGWRDPAERRRILTWTVASLGLGVVLWLPPTIDQLTNDPGNERILIEHFTDPPEEAVGPAKGVELAAERLDVVHLGRAAAQGPGWLVDDADGNQPSAWRGAVVLLAWLGAVVVTVRRRDRDLVRLHVVVGASTVLMAFAVSRIFGTLWYYLSLWGWAIGLLMVAATAWTAATVVTSSWDEERRARRTRTATLALAAVAALLVGRFAVDAADSTHSDAPVAAELSRVVDDVADGLAAGTGAATGTDGRYLVTWSDALHIGSQGYGLVNELERRGFDVGVEHSRRAQAAEHRVLEQTDATARVHLATGPFIDRYRAVDGAVEVGYVDPRDAAERAEQARLREEVLGELHAAHIDDLDEWVDDNLFGASIDPRLTPSLKQKLERMLDIGGPLAVYVLPPDAADP